MPTLVTIKNIGDRAETIDGNVMAVGATLVVDLDNANVQRELSHDIDYVILPDSAAGVTPTPEQTIFAFDYDFAVQGGAQGTIPLTTVDNPVPDGSVPVHAWVECIQPLTSGGISRITVDLDGYYLNATQDFNGGPLNEFVNAGQISQITGLEDGSTTRLVGDKVLNLIIADADLTGGSFRVFVQIVDLP